MGGGATVSDLGIAAEVAQLRRELRQLRSEIVDRGLRPAPAPELGEVTGVSPLVITRSDNTAVTVEEVFGGLGAIGDPALVLYPEDAGAVAVLPGSPGSAGWGDNNRWTVSGSFAIDDAWHGDVGSEQIPTIDGHLYVSVTSINFVLSALVGMVPTSGLQLLARCDWVPSYIYTSTIAASSGYECLGESRRSIAIASWKIATGASMVRPRIEVLAKPAYSGKFIEFYHQTWVVDAGVYVP